MTPPSHQARLDHIPHQLRPARLNSQCLQPERKEQQSTGSGALCLLLRLHSSVYMADQECYIVSDAVQSPTRPGSVVMECLLTMSQITCSQLAWSPQTTGSRSSCTTNSAVVTIRNAHRWVEGHRRVEEQHAVVSELSKALAFRW